MKLLALILIPALGFGQAPAAKAPPAKKDATAVKPAAAVRATELKYPPMPELRLPEISSFTMANGMKVYLLENHELPLVRGYAMIRSGNVYEPADKTGLTDVFGEVVRSGGTKKRTGAQLNELLEGIAASVEANAGETSISLSFSTLSENTDTVLGVFQEVLTEPAFAQEQIDVAKNQYRAVIARRNDQPSGIASREFDSLIYGANTPWGRQMEYETLDRVARHDLIAFHERFFFPSNVILAVQGDFVSSTMRDKLEKLFAGWTVKQPPVPPLPPLTAKPKPGFYVATKPEVNQTFLRIGHLGGTYRDKDFPALDVMGDILGNGFTSRLVKRVRSDLGYAYSIGGGWSPRYDHAGTFSISGGTKLEATADTFKVILEEVEKLRTVAVSDEELRVAKETTLNSFVFNFDSPGKTLNRLVTYEYHGYPQDWMFEYQKAIAAVTKADVLRVAKEYIKPENFVLVAVGKTEDFQPKLAALNLPVHVVDLTIPQPKQELARMDSGSLARGKQLLQGLQNAVGGAEKLGAVKDYSHTAEVTVLSANLKVKQITSIITPEIRFEQQLPFGKIILYYDGKGGGWFQGPQGMAPALPPPLVKQAQEELFRVPVSLWLSDRIADRTVNAIGESAIEIRDQGGNWARLHIDGQTGLIAKLVFPGADQAGPLETEAVYEDWKETGGIKLPHKMKLTQRGKPAAEVVVEEYKLNSGLKSEQLSAKP
jgi:zinc protease